MRKQRLTSAAEPFRFPNHPAERLLTHALSRAAEMKPVFQTADDFLRLRSDEGRCAET
jgi:hypothetical protein